MKTENFFQKSQLICLLRTVIFTAIKILFKNKKNRYYRPNTTHYNSHRNPIFWKKSTLSPKPKKFYLTDIPCFDHKLCCLWILFVLFSTEISQFWFRTLKIAFLKRQISWDFWKKIFCLQNLKNVFVCYCMPINFFGVSKRSF